MDIHVVIVHNNLILIFPLLLSLISLKKYLDVKANKLETLVPPQNGHQHRTSYDDYSATTECRKGIG